MELKGSRTDGAPDLTDGDWLYGEGRVADIERIVLYGIRSGGHRTKNQADMPAYGRAQPYSRYAIPALTPHEIADVASYLEFAQGRNTDPDAVKRGVALFDKKAQCFDCHGNDLGGDNFIGAPNLTDKIWLNGDGSRRAMIRVISQGRAGVCPMFDGKLSPAQIRAVAIYVHSKSQPNPAT